MHARYTVSSSMQSTLYALWFSDVVEIRERNENSQFVPWLLIFLQEEETKEHGINLSICQEYNELI